MVKLTKKPLNLKRVIFLTSLIILLPIFYGVAVYAELPMRIAIHWGVNNQPNGWTNRPLAVFGIPVLMMLIQWFMIGMYALNTRIKSRAQRMELVTFSIVPILNLVLYIITLNIAMGEKINTGKVALLLIGVMFIALGNYMPTVTYEQQVGSRHYPKPRNPRNWAFVSRRLGYTMVFGGILVLISLFFPWWVSVVIVNVVIILLGVFSLYGALKE
ncbi:DUF1648 domain-containing protein [Lapidilactobacillus bayanensis]|uniref:DUF1648 domain-containing protein n=1 Tax=Lapidilactobacillus bayanensis TaxID=2485998 RepID=UPI000F76D127|nr:DUF1648 domain-containing protein [Lapidilactobacillus bayanensis]